MLVLRIIKEKKLIDCTFFSQNAFGLDTNFYKTGCSFDTDIWVKTSAGVFEASTNELVKGIDILNKYKIITGSMNTTSVINKAEVLNPGMACTRTYTVLGVCSDLELANRLAKYMQTKFVRALIAATLNNQMVSKENYRFVPMQDFFQIFCKNPQNLVKQRITPHFLTTDHPNYYEFTTKG